MRPASENDAFALAETMIALGVAAFCLTALLGLLSVALAQEKESLDDTVLASITSQVVADLRRQNFSSLTGTSDVEPGQVPVKSDAPALLYFDTGGKRLLDENGIDMDRAGALAAGAVYQCTETMQGDANTLTAAKGGKRSIALLNIELKFEWPAQAPAPPNQRIIHAAIARYQ